MVGSAVLLLAHLPSSQEPVAHVPKGPPPRGLALLLGLRGTGFHVVEAADISFALLLSLAILLLLRLF